MKVFLGGTCNESTWRNRIIPMLAVGFFNPVVEDWTPECMDEELRQREECDICLYVITPKMSGVYSVAEVIDDSNKRPARTVFVRLRDDDDERFTDGQWRSLGAVAQMVERNGGAAFDSLKSAALHINAAMGAERRLTELQEAQRIVELGQMNEAEKCPVCGKDVKSPFGVLNTNGALAEAVAWERECIRQLDYAGKFWEDNNIPGRELIMILDAARAEVDRILSEEKK